MIKLPIRERIENVPQFPVGVDATVAEVIEELARAGLESSNLIVAIDFTKSNEWTGPTSFAPIIEMAMTKCVLKKQEDLNDSPQVAYPYPAYNQQPNNPPPPPQVHSGQEHEEVYGID
ncbi:hypothetical protein AgCh_008582 [Apium graveolens]